MAKQMEAHLQEEAKLCSPFPKAHQECKEEKQREESKMKHSRGQPLSATSGALPGAQNIHTIFRFEAREVKSPTLQTVHKSELKRRSYGRLKTTAQS